MSRADDGREAEARAALERVRRDTDGIGSSALERSVRRAGDHFAARDAIGDAEAGGTDPMEVWGRRIGRALSLVLAFGLVWLLGFQLGWW